MGEDPEFQDLTTTLVASMAELGLIKTDEVFVAENEEWEASIVDDEGESDVTAASSRSLRKRSSSESSLHRTRNRKVRNIQLWTSFP